MITTLLAKVRQQYGLAPTASLGQINEAIDANTQPAPDEGAAAGAESVQDTTPEAASLNITPEVLDEVRANSEKITRAQAAEMITTALAPTAQAITDLNAVNAQLTEANAALSDRLAVVEGQDAEDHTGGKADPAKIVKKHRAYHDNPINQ